MNKTPLFSTLLNYVHKWIHTIKYSWSKNLTYRLNFFLEVTGPVMIFYFINYNLWTSIYSGDQALIIKGYNYQQMIAYHSWSMIVTILARGHVSANLSEDIRLGRISSHLIYPFNLWEFHTASFLAFQFLQMFIALFSILVFSYLEFIHLPNFSTLTFAILFSSFVSLFWFVIQYLLGLLAFWLEETWILRVMASILTAFLAGAYFPLELYPSWLQNLLEFSPFPYLHYYPVKIFMGDVSLIPKAITILSLWLLPLLFLVRFTWKKGIKLYTAAGM